MDMALELAGEARALGEVPVGAIIFLDGEPIGSGFNQVETRNDPTAHAEISAIREASKRLSGWRLNRAAMYVTLEPCVMCAGAILLSRISKLYFGAYDIKWGAMGTLFDLSHDPRINHEIEVNPRIREEESMKLLREFFKKIR
ncbi:tRNA-specific adenosine deaminase [Candidatus Micrarchaeota archaeon]|nr:tRNA-specific adenosine deaminase [Candidatus Micrarchaeota archaeon]